MYFHLLNISTKFQLDMILIYFHGNEHSAKATEEYELARKKVAAFINASDSREIVFTRNATEAINLVAYSWGLSNLKSGDEVSFPLLYFWFVHVFFNSIDVCFNMGFGRR